MQVIQRIDAPSPFAIGELVSPKGFLLHASRSGVAGRSARDEFASLVQYARANPDGLGWHASIGPGVVAVHMSPREWGYNARTPASYQYIAAEFSQPCLGDEIDDSQIEAYCWWVEREVIPVWPNIPRYFVHHANLESGQRDGKTDIYPNTQPDKQQAFIERILKRLNW